MPLKNINGIQLNFEINGQGENLLLIHGLGSSLRDWEYQLPTLVQHYKVISVDLRGHGQSDKPAGKYTIQGFAQDIMALLHSEQIEECHVLGISMGAAISYKLAIDYPKQIKSIIAVNMGASMLANTMKARFAFLKRVLIVKLIGMKKMGEILGKMLFPKDTQEHLRTLVASRWAENDKDAYLRAMGSLKNWSVEDSLHKIECPALIVAADQDYSPVAIKQAIANTIPKGTLKVMPDARHAVPIEKPEEFNQIVLDFLESL